MGDQCGKYLGDNDGTCPQLTCIRSARHEGPCDNVTGDQPPPRRVPEEKAEPCVSTCYDRASGSDTQCVEPAGHEGRHSDGCLEWEDAPPSLDDQPLTYAEEHALRDDVYSGSLPSVRIVRRLFATLDASRAANAKLQRENGALRATETPTAAVVRVQQEIIAHAGATMDSLRAANAEMRRALETATEALDFAAMGAPLSASRLAELTRAALRAAEKAPEAREPARFDADRTAKPRTVLYAHANVKPGAMVAHDNEIERYELRDTPEPAPPAAEWLTAEEREACLVVARFVSKVACPDDVADAADIVRAAAKKAGGR